MKLERALSSRRSPPHPADDEGDGSPFDDESKTKKHASLAARIVSLIRLSRSSSGHCPAAHVIIVILLLLLATFSVLLLSPRRSVLCVSPYDAATRNALVGADLVGLASDFGSLGVPWCKPLITFNSMASVRGNEGLEGRSKHDTTVEWTPKDLLKGLEEFVPIYETRPIKNNMYGMGFDHSFGLWFMARWLKPDLMIESGAFKGHSTWVLRQAMPGTHIISLSPRHPEKYLKKGPAYVDENCTYFAGKDFVDFGRVGWGSVMRKHGISDLSRVLVFFDDHQNQLKR
ncbi:hypothetical protein BHM03_00041153 [Ensete ventricosum]|uniref:Uncharacterized protein n=1 Tax=Ensete ventricosum TaxID=4639 RepID=A0A427A4X9_ENSVE|nr:hypothetical protein B296_00035673 [Ensete ventricosum]RZS10011.1 hypothetical protein BHM03_00041153 [Ensete ventricosum]